MKKLAALFLAFVMVLSLAACGGGSTPESTEAPQADTTAAPAETTEAAETTVPASNLDGLDPVNLSIGTSATFGSTQVEVCEALAKYANEYSGGKITIDVYPNGQLGGDKDIVELVSDNGCTFYVGNAYSVNYIVPVFDVFTIPCVGNNTMDMNKNFEGLNGDFLDLINEYSTPLGFRCMGFVSGNSFRNITSNKEYTDLSSLNGLDMRVTEQETFIKFWGDLGVNATPLSINELYIALQQGLVEAQENAYEQIVTNNFQEVQKYLILTNHLENHPVLVMNDDAFNDLDPAYQEILTKAAKDALKYGSEKQNEFEVEYRKQLEDAGMIFIEPSEADRATLKELSLSTIDIVLNYGVAEEVVDAYLEIYGMSR